MKQRLEKYPFFLVFLPLFLLTHIEAEYHHLINYRLVWGEIIFLLLVPPVAYAIAWLFTRSHRKAGILAFLILVIFYFFPETKDYLHHELGDSFWQSYNLLLAVILVVLVVAAIAVRRSRSGFSRAYRFINIALLLFIAVDIGNIAWKAAKKKPVAQQQLNPTANNCDTCQKPDIYFFIFDSYTSSGFLQDKFGFANTAIDSFLVKKGFRIVRASHSNYNLTPFSLASIFRQDYLPEADTTRDYYLRNYLPGVRGVLENPLFPLFHQMGYNIHNHSIFDVRSFPTTVPTFDIWHLYSIYRRHNLLKKLDLDIGYHFPSWLRLSRYEPYTYANNRDRHDSIALSHIRSTIKEVSDRPKFVYGHLFIPHSPFTFDSSGNKIVPNVWATKEEEMKAYVQQIIYVNRVMSGLVDEILSASKRPVAIIIQGDHGFRFSDPAKKQWEFPNFNAFYFSNGNYHWINDSTSSVNTFRIVGNTFFGQQFQMLPSRTNYLQYK